MKKKMLTLGLISVCMTLFFVMRNGSNAFTVLDFDEMGIGEKITLFFSVLYDVKNTFSLTILSLLFVVAFLQSSVLVLFYSYMKERNEALHVEKASIIVSTLLALFGTSCAACGGAALTVLSSLGIFGTGAFFSFDSIIVLTAVIVLLSFTLFRLLKKVENPFVC